MAQRVQCRCGRNVRNTFQAKWRHMVRYHPEHMAKKILPLLFKPPDELISMGRTMALDFIRRIT